MPTPRGALTTSSWSRPCGGEPLALVPALTAQVSGFGLRDEAFQVQRFVADGTMSIRDPTAKGRAVFTQSTVRANVADLTWPATTPGRVDVQASIPGGGALSVTGTVRPPPAATQLSLRVARLNLAPWAQLFPVGATVAGIASADLRIDEPVAPGFRRASQGTVAVERLGVADGGQQLLGAGRVEASGLELHWPERLVVGRVVSGPRAIVERDADGNFPLQNLVTRGERPGPQAPPRSA